MTSTNSPMQEDRPREPVRTRNNITVHLNKNLLGCISEFCNLNTQFQLVIVNRKFNEVLKKSKTFCQFILINRREDPRAIRDSYKIFGDKDTQFITRVKNEISQNLTCLQTEDFLNEFLGLLLNHKTKFGRLSLDIKNIIKEKKLIHNVSNALKHIKSSYLSLGFNDFGVNFESLRILLEGLKENRSITELYLAYNELGRKPKSLMILKKGLEENRSLTSLDLTCNMLGEKPQSMTNLMKGFKETTTVTRLILKLNNLGESPKSLKSLISGLKANSSLTTLNLESNNLGKNPKSLKILMEGLKNKKSIKNLNLHENYIGSNEESMEILLKGLLQNTNITTLNLSRNIYSSEQIKSLMNVFNENRTLTELELSFDSFGKRPRDLKMLIEGFKDNKSITSLILKLNFLGVNAEDIEILLECLNNNKTLTSLDLSGNDISKHYLERLEKVRSNLKIKFLLDSL